MVDVAVELGVHLGLEDLVEYAELRLFLGLEVLGGVEHFTVAVAKDVGRVPAAETEHAGLEAGGEQGLHEGLARLEILASDRDPRVCESSCMQGRSVERFGAPLANGTSL